MHRTLLLGDVHFCSDQDEAVCEQYMQQAAAGLIYLHDRHIVHFDIKLENMLLHQNVIKLCDFGYLLPPSPPKNLPSSNFPLPADVYGVRIAVLAQAVGNPWEHPARQATRNKYIYATRADQVANC